MARLVTTKGRKEKGRGFCRFPLALAHSRMAGGQPEIGFVRRVDARGTTLNGLALKTLVILLDHAQRTRKGLDEPAFDPDGGDLTTVVHRIRIADIKIATGSTHTGSDRLKDALAALASVVVEFDLLDADGDVAWDITTSIVSFASQAARDDGYLRYWFNPAIWPLLKDPRVFSRVYIETTGALTSPYAIRLYQALAGYAGRTHDRALEVERQALEDILGVPESYRTNFAKLVRHVLDPALTEVNERTDIRVEVSAERAGLGGAVGLLRFEVEAKEQVPSIAEAKREIVEEEAKAIVGDLADDEADGIARLVNAMFAGGDDGR